jgi:chorismate dehydratase
VSYTVGCVEYVNAKPLIKWFERLGSESPVRVVLDVPSRLPAMLDSGEAQAALVSSFEALRTPGRRFAESGSISTLGDAESVRLFSKVPFSEIGSLALDMSSLTSNHLARILLAERYGVAPSVAPLPPSLPDMLATHDAAILIGDKGMTADGTGLHVMDLGREWREMTGLPFVWALWVGGEGLTPELSGLLAEAERWGSEHIDEVIAETVPQCGWRFEDCDRYLRRTMNYQITPDHLAGLAKYRELLLAHGFIEGVPFPQLVAAELPSAV